MISEIKNKIRLNTKNIYGWKTKRRIVVFAVDDYGNVRLHSRKAKENLERAGLNFFNRFDLYDTLETEEDLVMLYKTLKVVKDKNGNHPVFTAFTLPANIDFKRVRENTNGRYIYEKLPDTFNKLKGYENVWDLWQEGIKQKLLNPQFHGREHINIKVFEENLKNGDKETLACLENNSYVCISNKPFPNIKYNAAYDFENIKENIIHKQNITDGLNLFEEIFHKRATAFTAPSAKESSILHKALKENGIKFLDSSLLKKEHMGNGRYKTFFNYTGKVNEHGQIFLVRNCQFEPMDNPKKDWVSTCLDQIEVAFRWNRPAIISSHRVNFCGHIDPANRKLGLERLKILLEAIVTKWKDVEFMGSDQLGNLIETERKN